MAFQRKVELRRHTEATHMFLHNHPHLQPMQNTVNNQSQQMLQIQSNTCEVLSAIGQTQSQAPQHASRIAPTPNSWMTLLPLATYGIMDTSVTYLDILTSTITWKLFSRQMVRHLHDYSCYGHGCAADRWDC
ncbi:hypothetical protein BIW11_03325 [Tropilaelaps mercedesae]|uniref:Uncharacterized protein n=1 Tax=Tropilaelaps mercedesae TaxID=418985 RepID=A0A1V9XNC7_9ACAR|nr:hypothetical protein BIW11_03325 [Tropilaelaps mercedesae]